MGTHTVLPAETGITGPWHLECTPERERARERERERQPVSVCIDVCVQRDDLPLRLVGVVCVVGFQSHLEPDTAKMHRYVFP